MVTMTLEQAKTTKPQIHIKKVYKHSISKVWTALTTKEALGEWLMKTEGFALETGKTFQFKDKPQGGWDGIVNCQILEFSQPNFIAYSWQANGMKNPTIVQWELKSIGEKETSLTLSHSGFEGLSGWFTRQILNFGWKGMLNKKFPKQLAV